MGREQQLIAKARRVMDRSGNGARSFHVVVGVSLQLDGSIPAGEGKASRSRVEVPSFLWAAYTDRHSKSNAGHFCRNGGPDNRCACADDLTVQDIEARVGFTVFPGYSGSGQQSLPTFSTNYFWLWAVVVALLLFLSPVMLAMLMRLRQVLRKPRRKHQRHWA